MNDLIILDMARPYVKDGAITYTEFDQIYNFLSLKEQYVVTEILCRNAIDLVDEHVNEDEFFLDSVTDEQEDENEIDFEIQYDDNLFKDVKGQDDNSSQLILYNNIKQSNEILCNLIQQNNQQAKQDLCVKNKRLVDKYVAAYEKYYGNHLDFEDLEQAGYIGLIKAADRYDSNQGTAFSTYAVFWIKQSISRELMDNGFVIRIPIHMMEKINKVTRLDNQFGTEGIPFNERLEMIAVEIGDSIDAVKECLMLRQNFLSYSSLNSPVGEEEDSEVEDFISDDTIPSIEDIITHKLLHYTLEEVLKTLKPREQDIIRLRFGVDDGKVHTLEEIGVMYGVTRERIRQLEVKALTKLRQPSRSRKLYDYLD